MNLENLKSSQYIGLQDLYEQSKLLNKYNTSVII